MVVAARRGISEACNEMGCIVYRIAHMCSKAVRVCS